MAITIQNHYGTFVSNNGSTNTYFFYAEWSGNIDHDTITTRYFTGTGISFGYTPDSTAETGSWATSLSANPSGIAMDIDMAWYPSMDVSGRGTFTGSTRHDISYVIAATASAPSAASITSSSASVSCNFVPNVTASVCTAQLQYKKTSDSTWINFGSPKTDGTGYTQTAISSISLTGLTASTSYDVRLNITRTTSANTSTIGATTTFVTLAGNPTVVTEAVTTIAHSSATLNSTITINSGVNVQAFWTYGIQNPPTDQNTSAQDVSGDGSFSIGITGLTASTLYYVRAKVSYEPAGTTSEGAVVSFTTSSNPLAEAGEEDHMVIQEYDAVYGVLKAFVFLAAAPNPTSSNKFLSAAAPWATTECIILIDGVLSTIINPDGRSTNAPTRIGTSAFYTITLTAGELAGENIWVRISDSAEAARDVAIHIRTSIQVGKIIVNASARTNTTAFLCTGVGTGHGASFVAGATGKDVDGVLGEHVIRKNVAVAGANTTVDIDTGASTTADFYNGAVILIISGTGAGQARFITDYVVANFRCTVHKAWGTNPASGDTFMIIPAEDVWAQAATAQLSSVPISTSSWADKLAFVFQRFAYKRTMSATVATYYKADDSTALGTAAVSDDGTTQTHARVQ